MRTFRIKYRMNGSVAFTTINAFDCSAAHKNFKDIYPGSTILQTTQVY